MGRTYVASFFLFLCIGFIAAGCSKKTVVKEEPSVAKAEDVAGGKEKVATLEAERKEREVREREAARIREEAMREEEAKKAQAQKEFEKSLTAKKTPGIEGEVFESKFLKDIYFEFDKYDIRPKDAGILRETAAQLRNSPKVKIQIEGHCDERGTVEYNLALGERRANSAKKYLISLGIPENRISTISYGEERPLDPGHNEETWAKNRRDHMVILSK